MKILSAFLIMVPATILVTAEASFGEPAAEACKASPVGAAPRGTHWYYHIDRTTKQHCWYLGQAGGRVRAHTRVAADADPAAATPADPVDTSDTLAAPGAPAQSASANVAQATPAQAPLTQAAQPQIVNPQTAAPPAQAVAAAAPAAAIAQPTGAGQAGTEQFGTRWPENLPKTEELVEGDPAPVSNSYAERHDMNTRGQMPAKWPLTEASGAAGGSIAQTALRNFLVFGIIAIPLLLLAGWLAKYARKPVRSDADERLHPVAQRARQRRRVAAAEAEADEPVAERPLVTRRVAADRNAQVLTDPAQDLKASLSELMRDLRRADGPRAPARRAAQQADGPARDRLDHGRLNHNPADHGDDAHDRAFGPYLQAAE